MRDATAITELGYIIPSRSSVRPKSHSLQPSTPAITNGFSVPWVDQEWNTSSLSSARTKWLVTGVLILTSLLLMGGPPLCSASTTIETNAGVSVGPDIQKCSVSGGSWPIQTAQLSLGVVPDLTRFALFFSKYSGDLTTARQNKSYDRLNVFCWRWTTRKFARSTFRYRKSRDILLKDKIVQYLLVARETTFYGICKEFICNAFWLFNERVLKMVMLLSKSNGDLLF